MGGFLGRIAGAKGCERQSGAGTVSAPNGAKITAIGIEAAANITNFKWTPKNASNPGDALDQITVTGKAWLGTSLAAAGPTAYIPLEVPADSVEVASGDVWVYFD